MDRYTAREVARQVLWRTLRVASVRRNPANGVRRTWFAAAAARAVAWIARNELEGGPNSLELMNAALQWMGGMTSGAPGLIWDLARAAGLRGSNHAQARDMGGQAGTFASLLVEQLAKVAGGIPCHPDIGPGCWVPTLAAKARLHIAAALAAEGEDVASVLALKDSWRSLVDTAVTVARIAAEVPSCEEDSSSDDLEELPPEPLEVE